MVDGVPICGVGLDVLCRRAGAIINVSVWNWKVGDLPLAIRQILAEPNQISIIHNWRILAYIRTNYTPYFPDNCPCPCILPLYGFSSGISLDLLLISDITPPKFTLSHPITPSHLPIRYSQ